MNGLLSAIVLQAMKDLQIPQFRSDAQSFFASSWFDEMADLLNMDAEEIRAKIKLDSVQFKDLRSAYH